MDVVGVIHFVVVLLSLYLLHYSIHHDINQQQ